MLTYIDPFDGRQGKVEFQTQSVAERDLLLKIERRQPLTTRENITVMHWLEFALAKKGHQRYYLVSIEGIGHSFTFIANQEGSGLGNQ